MSGLSSPFGSLIDEARRENLRRGRLPAGDPALPGNVSPFWRISPQLVRREPHLRLETGVVSPPPASRNRRVRLLPISLALHAAFLLAVLVVPLIGPESLPLPANTGRVFFVSPVAAAPPPPPPPPAAPALRAQATQPTAPRPTPPGAPAFVAPTVTPHEIKPAEGIGGPGNPSGGGAEGGVPGGVALGVVGGVVGGTQEPAPPPKPVRVGSVVKEPRKLRHVEATYPRAAVLARVEGLVVLECTIDVTGHVSEVRVLRGLPALDQAAVDAVKQWAYAPTLLDGVPVPVIMTATVSFSLKQIRNR